MARAASERIAYFNGRFVGESQVLVPFRDRGFKFGDAVFDTTRTFGHRIFKLREHVERLYRSLRYLRIDPRVSPGTMMEITEDLSSSPMRTIGSPSASRGDSTQRSGRCGPRMARRSS
jgi:branched-chain amino acid aminotransferase